jgi:hypothetical protein
MPAHPGQGRAEGPRTQGRGGQKARVPRAGAGRRPAYPGQGRAGGPRTQGRGGPEARVPRAHLNLLHAYNTHSATTSATEAFNR